MRQCGRPLPGTDTPSLGTPHEVIPGARDAVHGQHHEVLLHAGHHGASTGALSLNLPTGPAWRVAGAAKSAATVSRTAVNRNSASRRSSRRAVRRSPP